MSGPLSPMLNAIAVLAMASTLASAQFGGWTGGTMGESSPRMIHFGVGGGASVPVSHARDALKNGYNGQAWVSLTPRGVPVTVRAAFDFQRHELEVAAVTPGFGPSVPTAAIDGGTNQVLAGLANLRFDLRKGAVEPYVTIGLGGYNLKTDPSGAGAAGSSATRFGVNGGAGLAVRIS